ncbi:stage II sporulation protein [Ruminiclostridium sufflavum DSM 19573]|uniref:Stage II sporulation protein n=1 Tax=Ruminiclostridium sufflavum DSM 19573 TaxID=1121337 RepID=A0A318XPS5_9FIRM|nr:SpoIID/LytB domain-containing protein [Ruminiclostridium sufflavum]PYG89158.1 stage II sporulation protein [Ruminiclostridium sufflavum DSM 19573]
MNKQKKYIIITLLLVLCCTLLMSSFVFATDSDIDINSDVAQSIIYQMVQSINNKDWGTYSELQLDEYKDSLKDFLLNTDNQQSSIGILSVQSASIKEIKALPKAALTGIVDLESYTLKYGDVYSFLVGTTYKVKKESKYFLNGVNYNIILVGKENDKWKIVFNGDAPLEVLRPKGYGFNSDDETSSLKVIQEKYKGNIINKKGALLSTNKKVSETSTNAKILEVSAVQSSSVSSFTLQEPAIIAVYHMYGNSSLTGKADPYYHTTTYPSFDVEYVSDCLPVEVYDSWDIKALCACALAVKEYGWYNILHPKTPASTYGADVVDTVSDQRYEYNSHTLAPNCNNAAILETSICIRSSSDNIFNAQYRAGTSGSPGTQYGGVLSQYGTQYLATTGGYSNAISILRYYYSYSDKSSGDIKIFNVNYP